MRGGVLALHSTLAGAGGPVSEVLIDEAELDPEPGEPGPPQVAAAGPRAAGREHELELLLEMILEGSLLHYGLPRVVRTEDADLALLLGDQLFALGLTRLAALGDVEAISELGDLISLVAQAHAEENKALAEAVWRAGAVAVGWGADANLAAAKALAREGDPRATAALRDAAAERAGAIQSADASSRGDGNLQQAVRLFLNR